jgi:transcription initiation factor IIE alpha subunit
MRPYSAGGSGDLRGRILEVIEKEPFQMTKEEIAKRVGGRLQEARKMIDILDENQAINPRLVVRTRTDGRSMKVWVFGPSSAPGRTGTLNLVK